MTEVTRMRRIFLQNCAALFARAAQKFLYQIRYFFEQLHIIQEAGGMRLIPTVCPGVRSRCPLIFLRPSA